jgi:hypothetical protein
MVSEFDNIYWVFTKLAEKRKHPKNRHAIY